MKSVFYFLFVIILCGFRLEAADISRELDRINNLEAALELKGISGMLSAARTNSWKAPLIYSQWHSEHVSKNEQIELAAAARRYGMKLAKELELHATKVQRLVANDELFEETEDLMSLSEWSGNTEGYGNLFLAQRSLDLAAIGVAKLTADLSFSFERIEEMRTRLDPSWLAPSVHLRVLNSDAGAEIFLNANRDDMERIYGAGHRLLEEKRNPALFAKREKSGGRWNLDDRRVVQENLEFFEDTGLADRRPDTLLFTWNMKKHLAIISGLDLETVRKAKALVEFRKAVGEFPAVPKFTPEEINERELSSVRSAKAGLKITRMEETYESPGAAAFALAWNRYLKTLTKDISSLPNWYANLDVVAFRAYSEVRNNRFVDLDTIQTAQLR
jgi:hypothetical protein